MVVVKTAETGYDDFMEKWAAVTGAAVRTGRACALYLAECGYHLILHCRRSTAELQTLAAALNAKGLQTCTITADFSQDDGVRRFWNAANIPGLRVIVNNAAVYCPDTTDTALFRPMRRFTVLIRPTPPCFVGS